MPKAVTPIDPSRTTPQGLLHQAREFWRAATLIAAAEKSAPEFLQSPPFVACYLAGHCFELALKAHLRASGMHLDKLQRIGHNLANALQHATDSGLVLSPKAISVLLSLNESYATKRFEYIVTGVYSVPIWPEMTRAVDEVLAKTAIAAAGNLSVPIGEVQTSQASLSRCA